MKKAISGGWKSQSMLGKEGRRRKVEEVENDGELDNTIPGSSGATAASKRPLVLVIGSLLASYLIPETVASLRALLTVSL